MYLDELNTNMEFDLPEVVVSKERMIEFAKLYDPFPLHHDEEFAGKTRFGRLVAPGVMSFMSVWARYLEVDFFGKELLAGKSTKIAWHKPVYAEDVLRGRAEITNLVKRNARNGLVEITIEAYNQKDAHILSNVTEAIVKCRER